MAKAQLKFCANLAFLYQDKSSFCERLLAASRAGFKGIEAAFLYAIDINEYAKVKDSCGLQQVLINSYPGNTDAGEFGFLALPGREKDFENSAEKSFKVAEILNCKKIHFMSGKVPKDQQQSKDVYYKTLEANLRKLLPRLEEKGITALIEPINSYTIPDYLLNDFDAAFSIIKRLGSPLIKLQLDVFHLQQIHGALTHRMKEFMPYVGHIQVAQVPDRHEPDTVGEIDYKYVFDLISTLGYTGWIGLEYVPLDSTDSGLGWIAKYGLSL